MDRTILYRELVRLANPHSAGAKEPPNVVASDPIIEEADKIRVAISRLNAYLAKVRKPYLVVDDSRSLSNSECDELDRSVQSILRKLLAQIKQLETLEQERVRRRLEADKKTTQSPISKGVDATRNLHRRGVFVYLNEYLKAASDKLVDQQTVRLSRKLAEVDARVKPASIEESLANTATLGPVQPIEYSQPQFNLSPEQQQVLIQENDALLLELDETLQKAHSAEKSLGEISSIQSELAAHLQAQTEQANQLVDLADRTSSDIRLADSQLRKADQRNRRASQFIIYSSLVIALLLLVFDYTI